MKSKVLGVFLAGLILVTSSIGNVWAQTPFSINYQGRLTDTATGFTLSNDPSTSADGQIDIMLGSRVIRSRNYGSFKRVVIITL